MAAIALAGVAAVAAAGARGVDEEKELAEIRRQLVVPVAPAPTAGKPRWRTDREEATNEARRRNCPLLVVFSDDKSKGLDAVEAAIYAKPAFVEFSRELVLLIALDGSSHKSSERDVGGARVAWCGRFDVPCEEHRQLHQWIYERFVLREYWNPLHLFLDAEGNELGRTEGHEIDQARLDRELAKTRRRLGPAIGAADYDKLMKRLKAIVDGRGRTGAAAADVELGELVAAQERSPEPMKDEPARGSLRTAGMVEYVNRLRERIGAEGEAQVRVAEAKVRGGDVAGARALLEQTARSWRELPAGKRARDVLAKLPQ
jgi:hypothetical protein